MRLTQLLILSSLSLVAGVALGQTGLIVEPWRKATPATTVSLAGQPMPASGLPPVAAPPRKPEPQLAAATPAVRSKWSPPIVELLVDPWAKAQVAAPAAPGRWIPSTIEIIDPWAGSEPAPPRVARRSSRPVPSTIF